VLGFVSRADYVTFLGIETPNDSIQGLGQGQGQRGPKIAKMANFSSAGMHVIKKD